MNKEPAEITESDWMSHGDVSGPMRGGRRPRSSRKRGSRRRKTQRARK